MNTILTLDHTVLLYIITHFRSDLLTSVMYVVTSLGNGGMIWITLTLCLLVKQKTRRCGIAMAAALLVGVILGEGLIKHIICRSRPFAQFSDITALITPPVTYSFPSGHTLSSFAAATVCFAFFHRAGILAYCLAALIAFSRLYLGVHFPSDVLASMLLGLVIGMLAYWLGSRMMDRLHYARLH